MQNLLKIPWSREHTWARIPEEKANIFASKWIRPSNWRDKHWRSHEPRPTIGHSNPSDIWKNFWRTRKLQALTSWTKTCSLNFLEKQSSTWHLCNSILRTGHFPTLWKMSQIIIEPNTGKPSHNITSYRPISLLPVMSKLFEKILLKRLMKPLLSQLVMPNHQFGFRKNHGIVKQIHKVCKVIRTSLENKEHCSAAFLDIQQAFDRIMAQRITL